MKRSLCEKVLLEGKSIEYGLVERLTFSLLLMIPWLFGTNLVKSSILFFGSLFGEIKTKSITISNSLKNLLMNVYALLSTRMNLIYIYFLQTHHRSDAKFYRKAGA